MRTAPHLILLMALCAVAGAAQHWDGSRTVPVHRLPVFDADGQRIVPVGKRCAPLSTRQSCNSCHDYKTINQGWHFNAGMTDQNGRPGEPWVLQDAATGTQLPMSWRGGKGVWKPDQVGMDAWRFTKEFGRNLPGGGKSDPDDLFEPGARWNVTGPLEINCLACHNQAPVQDHSEWAKQIGRENWRWAATAAAGLGEVGGMAARMLDLWAPDGRPNLDDNTYRVPPSVEYDAKAFDSKHRLVFDMGRPKDANCLACHSVGHHGKGRTETVGDIHTRAGMSCVDCHRNGLDHRITRGYEGEHKDRPGDSATAMSCRGCHMGTDASAGRFGAQRPAHKGLHPVHLEKLSCTACHSGAVPASAGPELVRTSRANRLGIHGRAIWDTQLPLITEPVFAPGHDGKITPHRAMWPAFWARVEGDQLKPLLPEAVTALAGEAIHPAEGIAKVLNMLTVMPDVTGVPVLGMGGQALKVKTDLELVVVEAKGVPAGKPQWGFLADGAFSPLIPTGEKDGDVAKERIETLLKVLFNAGIRNPAVSVGTKRNRINPIDGAVIAEDGAADAPLLGSCDDKKQILPLVEDLDGAVASVLITAGKATTVEPKQVAAVLKAMAAKDGKAAFAYVANGRLHKLEGGTLASATHPQADPVLWPLGHDVRPAQQALGATGCTECHSQGAPFLTAAVTPVGPLAGDAAARPMTAYAGLDAGFHQLFGLSFLARPFFKFFLFTVAGGMLIALLIAAARARMAPAATTGATCSIRLLAPAVWLAVLAGVLLALTGFIPFLAGKPLTGWSLMAHNAAGGGFAFALAVMACLGLCLQSTCSRQSCWRWLMVGTGTAAILSAVTMMIPWQGTDGLHTLMVLHRIAALLALVAGIGTVLSGGAKTPSA